MSTKKLQKPKKQVKEYYEYMECRDYLEKKYKYKEQDYRGEREDDKGVYCDFWHWVCDRYDIHNGCYICFEKDELNYIEKDWVKTIFTYYINEFADSKGELEMYVWW